MFKMRTSKPKKWTALYNNIYNGGLSWCITGRPTDAKSNVLSNCVGYACSRFNEIYNELTGHKDMKYSSLCCNAEDFWTVAPTLGLKRGQTPKPGSIMCWQGAGDLAGHVAIVEKVVNSTQVYTSESGWDSPAFWNATRYKGADGNWGAGYGYTFRGFIYNPAVGKKEKEMVIKDMKKSDKYYKYCKTCAEAGLLKLDKKGNFNPDKPVTKKMLALVLCRLWKLYHQ